MGFTWLKSVKRTTHVRVKVRNLAAACFRCLGRLRYPCHGPLTFPRALLSPIDAIITSVPAWRLTASSINRYHIDSLTNIVASPNLRSSGLNNAGPRHTPLRDVTCPGRTNRHSPDALRPSCPRAVPDVVCPIASMSTAQRAWVVTPLPHVRPCWRLHTIRVDNAHHVGAPRAPTYRPHLFHEASVAAMFVTLQQSPARGIPLPSTNLTRRRDIGTRIEIAAHIYRIASGMPLVRPHAFVARFL